MRQTCTAGSASAELSLDSHWVFPSWELGPSQGGGGCFLTDGVRYIKIYTSAILINGQLVTLLHYEERLLTVIWPPAGVEMEFQARASV